MKMPYCSGCTIGEDAGPSHAITNRQRTARVIAGAGWLGLAWAFRRIPIRAISWPLTIGSAWLGVSHIVAGWTAYPDCPELGAIPSLIGQRYIRTRCGPWARLDRWLEARSSNAPQISQDPHAPVHPENSATAAFDEPTGGI